MYQHFLVASQRAPSALTASFSGNGVTRSILMAGIINANTADQPALPVTLHLARHEHHDAWLGSLNRPDQGIGYILGQDGTIVQWN